ncbi:TolC family protein, partial [Ideonella sp.]|uniref:TolC family protein n=1 Tax=Ideonella sp. TaxID=1929293 RepID=UPI003BB52D87
ALESPQLALPAAQPDAGRVTLSAALDAAWQRALLARESEAQRRRTDADRAVADSLWAGSPALSLNHRDDRLQGHAGRRETELAVAVPLWMPGQRAAQADHAEAAAAQAEAAEQVARLRLASEVRESAWQLASLQTEATQAAAQAVVLTQVAEDVGRRVQAGELARADALAAQAEQLAALAGQTDVQQRLQAARAHWTLLTGLAALPDPTEPVDASANATGSLHPALALALLSTALARQGLTLVRHSQREAPELTVGLRQDTPGQGQATQGSLVLGLRLPFGTDARNRPLEAAALSELDLAETRELRLREQLDNEVAIAREALRAAQVQLDSETARAALLRERAALIDAAFRAGETPLTDSLRARAAAAQALSAVQRQTAALGLARARLQNALGRLP